MTEIVHAADGMGHTLPAVVAPRPAGENPAVVYLASLPSAESRRTMRSCLDTIARLLGYGSCIDVPWHMLRYQHTAALRSRFMEQVRVGRDGDAIPWSASTVNKHIVALRRVIKEAWRLGLMTAEDRDRATDLENAKQRSQVRAGRNVADQEIIAMLTACLRGGGLIGIRDAAILAVLQSSGLRRAEVAGLRRRDYDPGERALRVHGKGGTVRDVNVHEVAADYLGRWLVATEHVTGPLFVPVNRWGKLMLRAMSPDAVADVVERRRRDANLPRMSTHDLRRTFAGALLDRNVDLARVQQLMGHVSPTTTAGYDRRPGQLRKEAIDRLTLPRAEELVPRIP